MASRFSVPQFTQPRAVRDGTEAIVHQLSASHVRGHQLSHLARRLLHLRTAPARIGRWHSSPRGRWSRWKRRSGHARTCASPTCNCATRPDRPQPGAQALACSFEFLAHGGSRGYVTSPPMSRCPETGHLKQQIGRHRSRGPSDESYIRSSLDRLITRNERTPVTPRTALDAALQPRTICWLLACGPFTDVRSYHPQLAYRLRDRRWFAAVHVECEGSRTNCCSRSAVSPLACWCPASWSACWAPAT